MLRQIFLDTETTGINKSGIHYKSHRIIEIGAVEVINRKLTNNRFHVYLNPHRLIDPDAFNIHGISDEFLWDKPNFCDIVDEFFEFIKNSELIIHNAPFDIGFINYELNIINYTINRIDNFCKITDSLILARKIFPGKRNNLNALCERFLIDNNKRFLHGALLDAEMLANVFLLMTSGQISMSFPSDNKTMLDISKNTNIIKRQNKYIKKSIKVIFANKKEITEHEKILDMISKHGCCVWRKKE